MTNPADLDELDDAPVEAGAVMFEAIRRWCRQHNDDDPTIVSRVYVIAECHDDDGRWLERGGFTADGDTMADWESLGFLEYARLREDRFIRRELDEHDEDMDDA